eukprot:TRINITY_DN7913_c0_g1_i1.p1 TRINITY_DN7913_c0_g1~~TRINITY_DN7913_c0_g1_i1.p1  ORF type:complete len:358 (-),score=48.13 TRINITY_DN7913_c0_g1_i1:179-1252(-)
MNKIALWNPLGSFEIVFQNALQKYQVEESQVFIPPCWLKDKHLKKTEKSRVNVDPAQSLFEMILNPEVDVIVCRSGLEGKYIQKSIDHIYEVMKSLALKIYSSVEILSNEDYKEKFFFGYCGDLPCMLLLESLGLVIPVHSPFVHHLFPEERDFIESLATCDDSIIREYDEIICYNPNALGDDSYSGYFYGGLSQFVLQSINIDLTRLDDAILFLEHIKFTDFETTFALLVELVKTKLRSIKAIIVGHIDIDILEQVLEKIPGGKNLHIPLFFGMKIGHLIGYKQEPVCFGYGVLDIERVDNTSDGLQVKLYARFDISETKLNMRIRRERMVEKLQELNGKFNRDEVNPMDFYNSMN